LKLHRFSESIAGFHVTDTPLHTLGCLLHERWVLEDVLNARAELIYFRRAALFPEEEPSFVFLPTSFFNDCRKLIVLPNSPYSPEIIHLRERIRSGNVDMLGFIGWSNDHYSAVFKMCILELEHGDSMHLPAVRDLLPILRWAFAGLAAYEPSPNQTYIQAGLIDRQATLAGGGSCGVAATNFIEIRIGLNSPR
jgi:hypothetical protein